MQDFLSKHIEEILGAIAGLLLSIKWQKIIFFDIAFSSIWEEMTIKFLVSVFCGIGGGLGGIIIKVMIEEIKKSYGKRKK
jgi:hypothetical protein